MKQGIFLLLGSNLGERLENIENAITQVSASIGAVIRKSTVYHTAPWGFSNQPDFYNQVIQITTSCSPYDLLKNVNEIERSLGRIRIQKWGERIIDIDILFFNEEIIRTDTLTIPHPGIESRRFTLVPLAEIAGNFIHPVSGKTITQLLQECKDDLPVTAITS